MANARISRIPPGTYSKVPSNSYRRPAINESGADSRTQHDRDSQLCAAREEFLQTEQSQLFNIDLVFTGGLEELGAATSQPMFPALVSTPDHWSDWIDAHDAPDLFNTPPHIPSDDLPNLASFQVPSSHSHQDKRPFTDLSHSASQHGDLLRPQLWADSLSESIVPIQTDRSVPPKGDRARRWCAVAGSPDSDDSSNVTEQLTNRLGKLQIAEDGHPRYFGSTSNLYILHHGPKSLHKPNIRDVMALGDAAAAKAGYHWDPDPEYETELITLFFSWYNALVNVVDQTIFYRERELFKSGKRSDLYSPALENAV